ncbi:MAG TPA: DUF1330 domain-containing protein [Candidatus Dormibacteraeota bacterium]|nr:DUF1330 domain-containing protein [Candidatus Dormibacteraeota bacterium]
MPGSGRTVESDMPAYLIAHVDITDPHGYEEYRLKVPAVVAAFGGRYLVRGGPHSRLEGDGTLARVAVIEFPTLAQLQAWYGSAEYRPLITLRQRCARSTLYAFEGL